MIACIGRAGGGLWDWSYLGVTSGQECGGGAAGLLLCSPRKSRGPAAASQCFSPPVPPPPASRGVVVVVHMLMERFGAPQCTAGILWGGFSCPMCGVSGRSTGAVLEPPDPSAPGSASLSRLHAR